MGTPMTLNRADFQKMALTWIASAKTLLAAKLWGPAYYVAGYAVECGLKACIMKRVEQTGVIFAEKKFAERCWTHDLTELVELAGLKKTLEADRTQNPALKLNWLVVKDWDESSRYLHQPHHQAKKLYRAITDKAGGMMPWVMKHW
jgi:hypothetical protein